MNRDDAQRIAGAVNVLRPEWPVSSLMTLCLNDGLRTRPWRDVLIALTWVAADPQSRTPGRVTEAGPWWQATRVEQATVSTITTRCPDHPTETAYQCQPCADAKTADPAQHIATIRQIAREARR